MHTSDLIDKVITIKAGILSGAPMAIWSFLNGVDWGVFLAVIPVIVTTAAAAFRLYSDYRKHRWEQADRRRKGLDD